YKMFRAGTEKMPEIDIAKAVAHMKNCQADRQKLSDAFALAGVDPFVIFFEDVYRDHDIGKQNVARLMSHVGIDTTVSDTYEADLNNALKFKGQNSASMLDYVPNIDALRRKLAETAKQMPQVFSSSVGAAAS
ncbi:MAG: hypothetical protein ACSHW1_17735, partial [Yoonia sp.]|uniref:hypothetical protein n=1 Tax=Yoonia sp. TaxID=2212373 RepID=UPI003EF0B3C7